MTGAEPEVPGMGDRLVQAVQEHLAGLEGNNVGMVTGMVALVTAQHLDGEQSWWHVSMPGQDDFRSDELAQRLALYNRSRVQIIMNGIIYAEEQKNDDD